jgi:hypothetical protein
VDNPSCLYEHYNLLPAAAGAHRRHRQGGHILCGTGWRWSTFTSNPVSGWPGRPGPSKPVPALHHSQRRQFFLRRRVDAADLAVSFLSPSTGALITACCPTCTSAKSSLKYPSALQPPGNANHRQQAPRGQPPARPSPQVQLSLPEGSAPSGAAFLSPKAPATRRSPADCPLTPCALALQLADVFLAGLYCSLAAS